MVIVSGETLTVSIRNFPCIKSLSIKSCKLHSVIFSGMKLKKTLILGGLKVYNNATLIELLPNTLSTWNHLSK